MAIINIDVNGVRSIAMPNRPSLLALKDGAVSIDTKFKDEQSTFSNNIFKELGIEKKGISIQIWTDKIPTEKYEKSCNFKSMVDYFGLELNNRMHGILEKFSDTENNESKYLLTVYLTDEYKDYWYDLAMTPSINELKVNFQVCGSDEEMNDFRDNGGLMLIDQVDLVADRSFDKQ